MLRAVNPSTILSMNRNQLFSVVAAVSVAFTSVVSAAEGWTEDYEKAKETAAKDGKDLLIDFTGSDWCGWCIKLTKEVFSKDGFKAEAPKHFVLVELDFPQQKEQPDAIKKQNEKLQEQFGIEGFPTIVLADAKGRPYATTGYQEGGAEAYLKHLAELRKVREDRDAGLKKAEGASGLEKAKLIAAALEPLDEQLVERFYKEEVETIISLDKEDTLGMKKKSDTAAKMEALNSELEALGGARKFKEFEDRIEKFIADEKLAGEERQEMMMQRLQVYGPDRLDEADKLLDEVIKVKDDSDTAEQARQIKERIVEMKKQVEKSKKSGTGDAGEPEAEKGEAEAEKGEAEAEAKP
jgi:thioredoxin-related protein